MQASLPSAATVPRGAERRTEGAMDLDSLTTAPTLSPDLVAHLRHTVAGRLDQPGAPGYAGTVPPTNSPPLAVVHVRDTADVSAVVGAAREHGLPVSVAPPGLPSRSGPHGGLQVNTSALDHCTVDAQARTARIGSGVRWRALLDAAAPHTLVPVVGTDSRASAAGDLVTGGTGLLARTLGHPVAAVDELEVVTGDGLAHTVRADSAPDLFWALRGGDLGLGVVTAVTLRLVDRVRVHGGRLSWRGSAVRPAFAAYVDWAATVPGHVTSVATLRPASSPTVADRLDVDVATTVPEGLGTLLAPLRAARPSGEVLHDQPLDLWTRWHPAPAGASTTVRTLPQPLGGLDDTGVEVLLGTLLDGDPRRPAVRLHHLGGELARPIEPPAAVVGGAAEWNLVGCSHDHASLTHPAAWPAVRASLAGWTLPRWSEAAAARRIEVHGRHDPLGLFAGPADA
jgi:hypothetical protein